MSKNRQEILLTQHFLPEFGGSIRWLLEVYSRWPTKVDVLCHDYAGLEGGKDGPSHLDTVAMLRNFNVRRSNILMKDWGLDSFSTLSQYLRMIFALIGLIRGKKADSVRIHCARLLPEAATACLLRAWVEKIPGFKAKISVMSYLHGEEILACESSYQLRKMLSWTAPNVDLIVANSLNSKNLLTPYLKEGTCKVVSPGVESEAFPAIGDEGQAFRAAHSIPEDVVLILSVGRLNQRKNFAAVLEAIGLLREEHPEQFSLSSYIAIGDGPDLGQLQQKTARLGLDQQVHFLGSCSESEKIAAFAAADLFVMPSIASSADTEGFGIVFLEAAAAGLPAIAGDAGGQKEAVVDGKTAFVVDGRDASEIAERLAQLIRDPALRESMGNAARAHAEKCDWENVFPVLFDTIESFTALERTH